MTNTVEAPTPTDREWLYLIPKTLSYLSGFEQMLSRYSRVRMMNELVPPSVARTQKRGMTN